MSKTDKADTPKRLLALHGCILAPQAFLHGLSLAGVVEQVEYLSSTGSGEVKHFYRITAAHSRHGVNKFNPFHETKTDPLFYGATFLEAYEVACKAIYEHATRIAAPTGE